MGLPLVAAALLGWSVKAGACAIACAIACDAEGGLDVAGQPWTIRAAEGLHWRLAWNVSVRLLIR